MLFEDLIRRSKEIFNAKRAKCQPFADQFGEFYFLDSNTVLKLDSEQDICRKYEKCPLYLEQRQQVGDELIIINHVICNNLITNKHSYQTLIFIYENPERTIYDFSIYPQTRCKASFRLIGKTGTGYRFSRKTSPIKIKGVITGFESRVVMFSHELILEIHPLIVESLKIFKYHFMVNEQKRFVAQTQLVPIELEMI